MARGAVTVTLIAVILGLSVIIAGIYCQSEPAFTANNLIEISDLPSL